MLRDEIKWPSVDEKVEAASYVHEFPGCIGIIDGTLVKIRRPWRNENHGRYFNGQKNMYCINNLVVVDHFGLVIYVKVGLQVHTMISTCYGVLIWQLIGVIFYSPR